MANNSGHDPQSGNLSDLAFHLHDLKQLTEELSNLAEAMQQAASTGGSADGSDSNSYGYS